MKSNPSQQKFMLIQSMKKLVNHISQSPIRQRDIFNSLSKKDLLKIFNNLNDQNLTLRKISAQLLCSLIYQNDSIKQQIIKLLEISPANGRICFNKFPQYLITKPLQFKYCLELLKQPIQKIQMTKMCWIVDLSQIDKKMPQIQLLEYKRQVTDFFPDPKKVLFGFTYFIHQNENRQRRNSKHKSIQRKRQKSTSRSKLATPKNKGRLTGYLASSMRQSKINNSQFSQQNNKQLNLNLNTTTDQKNKKSSDSLIHFKYIKPVSKNYINTSQEKSIIEKSIINNGQENNIIKNNFLTSSVTLPQNSNQNKHFGIQSSYKQQVRNAAYSFVKADPLRKSVGQQNQFKYSPNIAKMNNFTNPMKFSYIPMANRTNPIKSSINQRPYSNIGPSYMNSNQNNNNYKNQLIKIQQNSQHKTLKGNQSQTTKSNSHNFMLKSFQFDPFTD